MPDDRSIVSDVAKLTSDISIMLQRLDLIQAKQQQIEIKVKWLEQRILGNQSGPPYP